MSATSYRLYLGAVLIGRISNTHPDFPGAEGKFEPTPEYKSVRHLFDQEYTLLKSGKLDEWEKVRNQMCTMGVRLEAEGQSTVIHNPILHIEGAEVWWRWTNKMQSERES